MNFKEWNDASDFIDAYEELLDKGLAEAVGPDGPIVWAAWADSRSNEPYDRLCISLDQDGSNVAVLVERWSREARAGKGMPTCVDLIEIVKVGD